jgi:hypothetical protein
MKKQTENEFAHAYGFKICFHAEINLPVVTIEIDKQNSVILLNPEKMKNSAELLTHLSQALLNVGYKKKLVAYRKTCNNCLEKLRAKNELCTKYKIANVSTN